MTIESIATQRAHHRLGPAAPLSGQPSFISALYNNPFSTRWFVISFGVDTSLAAGPGWDQATGLGTPNGWNFVQSFGGDD